MSKNEILTQVYPDEIEYIYDQERTKEIRRVEGMYNQLIAGLLGNSFYKDEDNITQNWFQSVAEMFDRLNPSDKESKQEPKSEEEVKSELDKLRGLSKARG